MDNGSFFAKFEFKENVSGFYADVTADRLYSLEWEQDRLLRDSIRIIRKRGGVVTYQHFCMGTTDLLRISSNDNGKMSVVFWKHNRFGDVCETNITRDVDISKQAVLSAIDKAIELFQNFSN
jgi:hypothetical protein